VSVRPIHVPQPRWTNVVVVVFIQSFDQIAQHIVNKQTRAIYNAVNKLICATTIKKWMKFLKNEQNTKIDAFDRWWGEVTEDWFHCRFITTLPSTTRWDASYSPDRTTHRTWVQHCSMSGRLRSLVWKKPLLRWQTSTCRDHKTYLPASPSMSVNSRIYVCSIVQVKLMLFLEYLSGKGQKINQKSGKCRCRGGILSVKTVYCWLHICGYASV